MVVHVLGAIETPGVCAIHRDDAEDIDYESLERNSVYGRDIAGLTGRSYGQHVVCLNVRGNFAPQTLLALEDSLRLVETPFLHRLFGDTKPAASKRHLHAKGRFVLLHPGAVKPHLREIHVDEPERRGRLPSAAGEVGHVHRARAVSHGLFRQFAERTP